jgi:hypothetical protein
MSAHRSGTALHHVRSHGTDRTAFPPCGVAKCAEGGIGVGSRALGEHALRLLKHYSRRERLLQLARKISCRLQQPCVLKHSRSDVGDTLDDRHHRWGRRLFVSVE